MESPDVWVLETLNYSFIFLEQTPGISGDGE
jgi:hypothetical protein